MDFFVTGGTGFVGSHLLPALLRHGSVTCLVHPEQAVRDLPEDVHQLDGRLEDISKRVDADAVVHLAGIASPQECAADPARAVRMNAEGTQRVLDATPEGARFVFISTGQVFGPTSQTINEGRVPDPRSVYGASKLAAEALVSAAHRRGDVEAVIVRPFNMYGPRQTGPYVVPDIIRQLTASKISVRSGDPVRDFTFIRDAVELIARCAIDKAAAGETFHLASGTSVSIRKIAEIAARATGKDLPIVSKQERPDDIVRVDPSKAERLLGWRAATTLEEGFQAVIAWHVARTA